MTYACKDHIFHVKWERGGCFFLRVRGGGGGQALVVVVTVVGSSGRGAAVGISGYSNLAPSSHLKTGQQTGNGAVLLVFSAGETKVKVSFEGFERHGRVYLRRACTWGWRGEAGRSPRRARAALAACPR